MARTLHFESAEGKFVELVVDEPGTRSWRAPGDTFSAVFDNLRADAESLAATIDRIKVKPTQVEVSPGMKLSGDTGAAMAVFVKGGVGADLSLKLRGRMTGRAGEEPENEARRARARNAVV